MSKNNKKSNNNHKNASNTKKDNRKTQLPAGDMRTTPTDYDIPGFGFKSAIVILAGAIVSTIILPLLFELLGFSFNLVVVLANTIVTSYTVAYSRYFIETKRGFCKRFWYTYAGFALSFFVLGFFWLYLNAYI